MNVSAISTSSLKRRTLCERRGQGLLLASSPLAARITLSRYADAFGLAEDEFVSSPLCSVPLVRFGPDGRLASGRTPAPEAMWHPLLWMADPRWRPQRGANGQMEREYAWAIRVALELAASGLYDEASGTWLDVAALAGVDVGTGDGRERMAAWLGGAEDRDLDRVDLSAYVANLADPHWALRAARETGDDLVICSFALGADSLLGDLLAMGFSGQVQKRSHALGGDAVAILRSVADVGRAWFGAWGGEAAFWEERCAAAAGCAEQEVASEMEIIAAHLAGISAKCWPLMTSWLAAWAALGA